MHLLPRELDKLVISQAGFLAQRRLARGVRLNHIEATALITNVVQELIRDGNNTVAQLMSLAKNILGRRHVHPSVAVTLPSLQVEGTFTTGTHLVTVGQPISSEDGNIQMALYGSLLPTPPEGAFPTSSESDYDPVKAPGAIIPASTGDIVLNPGKKRIRLTVTNKADRPIHVGSHFHFVESNRQLDFDRAKAYGYHLDVPSGKFVRFDAGSTKFVVLTQIGGLRTIKGGSGLATGMLELSRVSTVVHSLQDSGYLHTPEDSRTDDDICPFKMDRASYSAAFGPTVGDTIRLGTTELCVRIEKDYATYGDECTLGDGKTARDGIGQASGRSDNECADLVIANALVIDWSGIFKADIGVKDGFIVGIGKAGNPDTMDGVNPNIVIGSNTDIIAAEGKIVTAGGIDPHAHLICPQQAEEALASGITTMFAGGTGPSASSLAVNNTPSRNFIRQMMQSCDGLPVNYGIIGRGSDSGKPGLYDQCNSGVAALKLHEDLGCMPTTIDTCLSVCDEHDIQCQIHTDTLNEAGFAEDTAAAFKGRAIHVYHIEGAGGGHVPDVMSLVREANVLPSSTTPTMPYSTNTIDEHVDMLMTCHNLSRDDPDDLACAKDRVRSGTIAAEDVLHDTGAISMMSSDSQAMGRCGEIIVRTWNTAHANKVQRGPLPEDGEMDMGADNHRVKRYISKYTINPALTQGIGHVVGSVEVGKLADLVVWEPCNFGTKPSQVLKKGFIAMAEMGDPNATIPTSQPIISRPMFSSLVPEASVMFVSKSGMENGAVESYNLRKHIEAVKYCRTVTKGDMKFNSDTPSMEINPQSFAVKTNGLEYKAEPASSLPLTQQSYLY